MPADSRPQELEAHFLGGERDLFVALSVKSLKCSCQQCQNCFKKTRVSNTNSKIDIKTAKEEEILSCWKSVLDTLEGSFALAVVIESRKDFILFARKSYRFYFFGTR